MRLFALLAALLAAVASSLSPPPPSPPGGSAEVVLFGCASHLALNVLWQDIFTLWGEGRVNRVVAVSRGEGGLAPVTSTLLSDAVSCSPAHAAAAVGPDGSALASNMVDSPACRQAKAAFLRNVTYAGIKAGAGSREEAYADVVAALDDGAPQRPSRRIVYLAVWPDSVPGIIDGLAPALQAASSPPTTLLLEKPIGSDAASAATLLHQLGTKLNGSAASLCLVDHYLAKPGVGLLTSLASLGHPSSSPASPPTRAWGALASALTEVQLTMLEADTLPASRVGAYRNVGVVRDMLQSHASVLLAAGALGAVSSGSAPGGRATSLAAAEAAYRTAATRSSKVKPSGTAGLLSSCAFRPNTTSSLLLTGEVAAYRHDAEFTPGAGGATLQPSAAVVRFPCNFSSSTAAKAPVNVHVVAGKGLGARRVGVTLHFGGSALAPPLAPLPGENVTGVPQPAHASLSIHLQGEPGCPTVAHVVSLRTLGRPPPAFLVFEGWRNSTGLPSPADLLTAADGQTLPGGPWRLFNNTHDPILAPGTVIALPAEEASAASRPYYRVLAAAVGADDGGVCLTPETVLASWWLWEPVAEAAANHTRGFPLLDGTAEGALPIHHRPDSTVPPRCAPGALRSPPPANARHCVYAAGDASWAV